MPRNLANRAVPVQLQLRVQTCLQVQLFYCFRLHCKHEHNQELIQNVMWWETSKFLWDNREACNDVKHRVKSNLPCSFHQTPESKHARTMVLDLQGVVLWFEGPVRRGAIHTKDDVGEIRKWYPCEVAAPPDSIWDDVCRTFFGMFQFPVPAEGIDISRCGNPNHKSNGFVEGWWGCKTTSLPLLISSINFSLCLCSSKALLSDLCFKTEFTWKRLSEY